MKNLRFATRWNADILDEYYEKWLHDAEDLDPAWEAFFEGFALGQNGGNGVAAPAMDGRAGLPEAPADVVEFAKKQARFTGAIYAFRSIGHTQATYNPLYKKPPQNPRLSLDRLGFTESDLDFVFETGNYQGGDRMSVRDLLNHLHETYCGSIGVEYLHIQETPQRRWLQSRMEPARNRPDFSREKKLRILDKLFQAETFEKFLHTRFVGQKRFGLEGGETLIAALDALVEMGPGMGFEEYVLGMAHRGRLNVLANVIGKSYEYIFHEFSENYVPDLIHGDGDVKYHLGYDGVVRTSDDQTLILQLTANPSHLEAVNPVVEGRVRARQRILRDAERKKVLPLLIHGDAAFAGQGIVAEVLNFSKLKGYTTGGTVHYIINNQIGFTTDPSEARSSHYCTDVAKMIDAPIFHVNGDDPLAMVWVTEMALQYRQQFGSDVVIDMYCYRRHGHNEADEPAFTQPVLYRQIKDHPLISETYRNQLIEEGDVTNEEVEALREKHMTILDDAFKRNKETNANGKRAPSKPFRGSGAIFQPPYSFRPVKTAAAYEDLQHVAETLTTIPEGFQINPKIQRQLDGKRKVFNEDNGIDWAFAESLAWGTLMLDGTSIRLSGQDSARGTFSQRHAVLYDVETRETFIPLMHMTGREGLLCVHNSSLSEVGILGFDYGYSLDYPQMLCMWEAQFGDFSNGAQVVIDQFIASAESKWQRISGLVMLLPHGYEGQGPEHSSARMERFLQLCAEDNMQICNMTTPAQYFHVLRRQVKRDFRKPLVIMAPKSLLRHKECVSPISAFTEDGFNCVLDDPDPPKQAERVILCSGKIYYDLIAYRRDNGISDAAIVRLEQIYPLHKDQLLEILDGYQGYQKLVWCQEEPRNMGAWSHIAPILEEHTGRKPAYAGRRSSASPAVGSLALHKVEQESLVEVALLG